MRATKSPFDRRRTPGSRSGSVGMQTPGRSSPLTTSTNYSSTSTTSSSSNRSTTSSTTKNPVKIAARSVAEALSNCFTPPHDESKYSSSFDDSSLHKAPSDASSASSENKHHRNHGIYKSSNSSAHPKDLGTAKFTMAEIYKATRNFSPSLKIGQGGFGTVYKGNLEDGTIIAVKRAKKIVYDKHNGKEFRSEVQTLAHVEHRNLVKFYGYLEHGEERILIVEYVPNGTLRDHLDGVTGNALDLAARLDVAIDVAHAIAYLHSYTDRPIIHRDIKSSNILLGENLGAKVADFGFARLVTDNESADTHISTQVKGTAGYLDPEYLRTYQLTEKSDVYSFGVLLVELVTGRRPIEPKREMKERITPKWAMKMFSEGDAMLILDPRVKRSTANSLALEKILELALQCLAPQRQSRPTMRKCAEILWTIRKDYNELAVSDKSAPSSN